MNSDLIRKVSMWVPLLIAAGYFAFLAMMWAKYCSEVQDIRKKFDEKFDSWAKTTPAPE